MDQPESAESKAFFDGFTPWKSEFKTTEPALSYEALKHELSVLPMTWYPALIKHMVECSYAKNVFRPGMASEFVKNQCESRG